MDNTAIKILSNKKRILLYSFLLLIVLMLSTGALIVFVVYSETASFDAFLIGIIQQNKSHTIQMIMETVTFLGTEYGVIIIIVLVSIWLLHHHAYTSLKEFLSISLITFITEVSVKEFVHRARPISWLGITASGYSFPSGHSIMTFVIIVEFIIILKRLHLARLWMYIVAFLMVLSVGISRIYLGVHWPSDVFGGWLIGSLIITAYSLLSMYHRLDGLHGKAHYI